MHGLARYVLEVVLSALLPIGFVYLIDWLAVKERFHLYEFLGDGQLSFYSTTVGVLTASDLLASPHFQKGVSAGEVLSLLTLMVLVGLSSTVWAVAVRDRMEQKDNAIRETSDRRFTLLSAGIALVVVVLGGILRDLAGVL
jgi:hypothetical protein